MNQIIKAAVDRGASDLHIKAGDAFRARVHGKLIALTKQALTVCAYFKHGASPQPQPFDQAGGYRVALEVIERNVKQLRLHALSIHAECRPRPH